MWSVKDRGYRDLVCDYWTWTSSIHASGASFKNAHTSEKLAQTLDFITHNQELFTRPKDAGGHGLVLIYPPDANDLTEAATCMTVVEALERAGGAKRAPQPPNDHRPVDQAWSQMDDDAHPNGHAATVPDATGYSGWE